MPRAAIDITTEILCEVAGVLEDAGLTIKGSLQSPFPDVGIVRLVVEGDLLPKECQTELLLIKLRINTEAYGKQRIHKISKIELDASPYWPKEAA